MPNKTSVVLADDHALVTEGLRSLIDRQPDMEVIHTVYNGDELLYLMVRDRMGRDEHVPGVVGTLMTNMAIELALSGCGGARYSDAL